MNGSAKTCARCGAALTAESALDVCPHCLAGQMLSPEPPAGASLPDDSSPALQRPFERVGERIGRYKLLERIGEGGCGVVYVAEQAEPVRRRVALKVIKLGMDTRAVVARFEAERQALAMMDHPNIAKVFDGGTTATGRPFFVMELVRGARITEYCDENRLSTGQRLELFVRVCHAVQHAHQKGIIHRDLKPSNILVTINDGVAVPKVIDFGVAKATSGQPLTDKTVYTAFEQFIGTPAYMSPEQTLLTSLDIDTRSDIYSLGVLLYELLTGRLPFDPKELGAAGLDEIRRTIREQEPPRPSVRLSTLGAGDLTTAAKRRSTEVSRLIHDIRGDLDWIVTRCLEKDRNRRYETANGLAADLQRHLRNEPIVARPPSRLYQFSKLARRNRVAFAAAVAVLIALLAGLAFSTWALMRERAARALASIEATKSQTVAKFHKEMIESMKPSIAMGRDTTLLREFADKSFEQLGQDLGNQPAVEIELRTALARVYYAIGETKKAEAIYRNTIPRMRNLLGDDHADLPDVLRMFSATLYDRGKLSEAEAVAREALALSRQRHREEHADVAHSLMLIGNALHSQKKEQEAEAYQRQALEMYRKVRGLEHLDVATTLGNLAIVVEWEGRLDEAEALYRESLAMSKRLFSAGHPQVIWVTKRLVDFHLRRRKNLDEAVRLLEELLSAQRKLLGNENREVAQTLGNLAAALTDNGRPAEAEPKMRESLALHERLYGKDNEQTAWARHDLGICLMNQNRNAEAQSHLREALVVLKKLLRPDSKRLEKAFFEMALCLGKQGKLAESEPVERELLEFARRNAATDPKKLEERLAGLADTLYRLQKYAEAEPVYRELIQIRSRRQPVDHEDVFGTKASLARLLTDWAWTDRGSKFGTGDRNPKIMERAREAERLIRECLALQLKGTNATHWRIGDLRNRLGGAILAVAVADPALAADTRQQRFAEAEALLLEGNAGIPLDNPSSKRHKRDAMERIVRLYDACENPAQAAEWRAALAALIRTNGLAKPEPDATP